MIEFESILDTPKDGLDPDVWERRDDGQFHLTATAFKHIKILVDYVCRRFDIYQPSVRITGSITSNQYSEESDIDIHMTFDGLAEDTVDYLNRVLRADFDENYKDAHPEESKIGNHPLEVYFQINPFQDLMSVGCYDFIQKMWLVGPDLKPLDFDPYSEYYSKDMEYVKDIIKDIRNNILECYETALVIQNSSDGEFKNGEFETLKRRLQVGIDIYDAARQCRKIYSSPTSVEDALKKRESKKWKIADSAFKLMDKFGYLKILKNFSKVNDAGANCGPDCVADMVVSAVGDSINLNETIDESVGALGKCLLIASILFIPGLMSRDALARDLGNIGKGEMKITSKAVQDAIHSTSNDRKKYGGYSAVDIVNMVARTLYVEGHSQGPEGRKAILSVILNRSGGKKENIAPVIKEKYAFSCWNGMTPADWSGYKYSVPSTGPLAVPGNPGNMAIWSECVRLAMQLFDGTFKTTIGNRNSYLNPDTAGKTARDSWGKDMDLQVKDHKFGYLREHDPKYVIPGTMKPRPKETAGDVHVVKNKETLSGIAKQHKMKLGDLLKKNPQIKNPDLISVGQKINV